MVEPSVQIEGLTEFRRALGRVDRELPKDLRKAMKSEVAEPVARDVRGKVPVRSGLWQKNIKAGATQRHAYVQWGRSKVPYAAWMEFGGGIPNKRNRRGDPPRIRRPFIAGGRYVHPTVEASGDRAAQAASKVLARTMRRASLQLD